MERSNKHYEIITLCGSTKFKDEFINAQQQLTLQGKVVISVGLFGHADGLFNNNIITNDIKDMLDDIHKQKIEMADGIYVINKDDYIGESTLSEIKYAKSLNKTITYMFPHNEGE